MPITAGRTIEKDQLVFHLAPSASLEVVLEGAAGSLRTPAQIYLFPIGPERVHSPRGQQTFPWHLVSPIELSPGGSKVIEGLPDGHLLIAVFRPGAIAERPFTKVRIYEGRTTQEVVKLLPGPALRGRVVRAGAPAEGVRVRLGQLAARLRVDVDRALSQGLGDGRHARRVRGGRGGARGARRHEDGQDRQDGERQGEQQSGEASERTGRGRDLHTSKLPEAP